MRSESIKKGIERAPHRALLSGCGVDFTYDLNKPFIAVVSSETNIIPGHVHLRDIKEAVLNGIYAGGGVPFYCSVPGICDGIAMGHKGMSYSLPSRELIADFVETFVNRLNKRKVPIVTKPTSEILISAIPYKKKYETMISQPITIIKTFVI